MSLYNLHYISGLHGLGYDVHYVERQNRPNECYDPVADVMTDDPRYALGYLQSLLTRFGITRARFSFIDREDRCHGSGWVALRAALDHADVILTLCDPGWFDELKCCPRRGFVDGDPFFTQVAMLEDERTNAAALTCYDTLFTYGVRMGLAERTLPTAGRKWVPTRPLVASGLWDPTPAVGLFQ